MPSTLSRAATKCISDVPGFVKQTSTPPATSVCTRLSAPFSTVSPIQLGMAHASKRALHLADHFTTTSCPDRTLFFGPSSCCHLSGNKPQPLETCCQFVAN